MSSGIFPQVFKTSSPKTTTRRQKTTTRQKPPLPTPPPPKQKPHTQKTTTTTTTTTQNKQPYKTHLVCQYLLLHLWTTSHLLRCSTRICPWTCTLCSWHSFFSTVIGMHTVTVLRHSYADDLRAAIAQRYSAVLVIERSWVRVPAEAVGEFSSPLSTFCADASVSVPPLYYLSNT